MVRPAGSRNKRTTELFDRISMKFPGFCPVEKMIQLGLSEIRLLEEGQVVSMQELKQAIEIAEVEGDSREYQNLLAKIEKSKFFALSCMKEVAPYLNPKLKALEIDQNNDSEKVKAGVVLSRISDAEWEEQAIKTSEELDKIALERIGEAEDEESSQSFSSKDISKE